MAEIEPVIVLDQKIDDRLKALERSEPALPELVRALGETVTPTEAGENDPEITRRHVELVGAVTEIEAGMGPKFEDVKEKLIRLTDDATDSGVKRALVMLLKAENKNISFDKTVDYGGDSDKDTLELTKLGSAVRVVGAREAKGSDQWGSFEKAADFLEDEYNIQVDRTVKVEVESEKKGMEEIISENENKYVNLLLADFDQHNFDNNYDSNYALLEAVVRSSDRNDAIELVKKIDSGQHLDIKDVEIFNTAQDIYLNHIFGEEQMNTINDFPNVIAELEKDDYLKSSPEIHKKTIKNRRSEYKDILNKNIDKIAGPKPKGREWKEGYADKAKEYLERRFGFVETVGASTGVDAVKKILGVDYLSRDPIVLGEGALKKKIEADTVNKDLLFRIIKVHNFTIRTESEDFDPGAINDAEKANINDALWSMLNLKKGETSIVPMVVSAYDSVMREMYDGKKKAIRIDDEEIFNEVYGRLNNLFDSPEEARLFIKMGRDVCRMTGLDAQYGWDKEVKRDVDKQSLELTEKGSFFRNLFNLNKSLNRYEKDLNLMRGIEIGVIPYWYSLRDPADTTRPITADEINLFLTTKLKADTTAFNGWIGQLKTYSETMKAEYAFMDTINGIPSLEKFNTGLLSAYMKLFQYSSPEKRKAYLLNRLGGYIDYKKTFSDNGYSLISEFNSLYFKKEGFAANALFGSYEELDNFLNKFGVLHNQENSFDQKAVDTKIKADLLAGKYGPDMQAKQAKASGAGLFGFVGDILGIAGRFIK